MDSQTVELNGSFTELKSYLWAGALSLAWHQLKNQIIKDDIKVDSQKKNVLTITENFNKCPFTMNDLSNECYYIRSGYGNQTVQLINKEVKKKFPKKTTPEIRPINPTDIISYAYFFKELKFKHPFAKKQVLFKNVTSPGFCASTFEHREQVIVHSYDDPENFIASLKIKSEKDEIFLIKTTANLSPESVREQISSINCEEGERLEERDVFEMPKISIKHCRSVKELIKVGLLNQGFKNYEFSEVYETINLDIDEEGVKVENEGVILLTLKCARIEKREPKILRLDREFWIVMREKSKHPYLICLVNELGKVKQKSNDSCSIF